MQPSKPRGAPKRNLNAFKHGFTSKVSRQNSIFLQERELLNNLIGSGRRDKEQASKLLLDALDQLRGIAAAKALRPISTRCRAGRLPRFNSPTGRRRRSIPI